MKIFMVIFIVYVVMLAAKKHIGEKHIVNPEHVKFVISIEISLMILVDGSR